MSETKELEFRQTGGMYYDSGDSNIQLEIKVPSKCRGGNIKVIYEEQTYKIGDRLMDTDTNEKYIMSKINEGSHILCGLICLEDGNNYAEFITVNSVIKITTDELNEMTGDGNFIKIKN